MNLFKPFNKNSLLSKIFVVLNVFDKFRERLFSEVTLRVFLDFLLDFWYCFSLLFHVNCHLEIVLSKVRVVHSEEVLPLSVRFEVVSRVGLEF